MYPSTLLIPMLAALFTAFFAVWTLVSFYLIILVGRIESSRSPAMDQMHRRSSQEPIRRRDAGAVQVTERDVLVLTWTAEQFCIAFDQLQRLLGRYAKAATKAPDVLSVSATRDAIGR